MRSLFPPIPQKELLPGLRPLRLHYGWDHKKCAIFIRQKVRGLRPALTIKVVCTGLTRLALERVDHRLPEPPAKLASL